MSGITELVKRAIKYSGLECSVDWENFDKIDSSTYIYNITIAENEFIDRYDTWNSTPVNKKIQKFNDTVKKWIKSAEVVMASASNSKYNTHTKMRIIFKKGNHNDTNW